MPRRKSRVRIPSPVPFFRFVSVVWIAQLVERRPSLREHFASILDVWQSVVHSPEGRRFKSSPRHPLPPGPFIVRASAFLNVISRPSADGREIFLFYKHPLTERFLTPTAVGVRNDSVLYHIRSHPTAFLTYSSFISSKNRLTSPYSFATTPSKIASSSAFFILPTVGPGFSPHSFIISSPLTGD